MRSEDVTLRDLLYRRFRVAGLCPRHGYIDELPKESIRNLVDALGPRTRLVDARPYMMCEGCEVFGAVKFRLIAKPRPKPQSTLWDARGYEVHVICMTPMCRDVVVLSSKELIGKHGRDMPWDRFTKMLRCKTCGVKGKAEVRMRYSPPESLTAAMKERL